MMRLCLSGPVRTLAALMIAMSALAGDVVLERRGNASWPTANHYRIRVAVKASAGMPAWVDATLPDGFNPDSVRVFRGAGTLVPSKTEWRRPRARLSWISAGP